MITSYESRYKKVANYCKRHNYKTNLSYPESWTKEEIDLADYLIQRHLVDLNLRDIYIYKGKYV